MYQQVTLIGNLGNDPEMRYTPSGVPVASFNMAVNKSWTTQDGQRQDKTTWFRITAWRRTAETVSQYLSKGRRVLVVGEVEEARPYTDRDGNPRASLEVTAQIIKFVGGRNEINESDLGYDGSSGNNGSSGNSNSSSASDQSFDEEDIPF